MVHVTNLTSAHLVWGGKMSLPGGGGGKIPATPGSDIKSMDWTTRNAYVAKFMTLLSPHQQKFASKPLESIQHIDKQIEFLQAMFPHIDPFDDEDDEDDEEERRRREEEERERERRRREEEERRRREEEERRRREEEERRKREEEERRRKEEQYVHLVVIPPAPPMPESTRLYSVINGRLKGCKVFRIRYLTPEVWVCKIRLPHRINDAKVSIGDEVLVYAWHMHFEDDDPELILLEKVTEQPLEPPENIQKLRIGSWNIRCTGEFQKKEVFFSELLQRFTRLAEVINQSECDVVALQEFPVSFNNSGEKLSIGAETMLPEFIIKLDECARDGSKWDFGFSEDFPQDRWASDSKIRNVKNSKGEKVKEYPPTNGEYVHVFVFKKLKLQGDVTRNISLLSVKQVLDPVFQENRFKHAPSLGRFTFMDNFHFSLCNVHLQPYVDATHNSFHEIQDLGRCIDQISMFNPKSTIFLGDFNMSAQLYAPVETGRTDRRRLTKFEPFVEGVWNTFREKNYTHAIRNNHTNTSTDSPKQFDNIWLSSELSVMADIREKRAIVPVGKDSYEYSCNVLEVDSGTGGREFITEMTDHRLVFVDLNVDVSKTTEFIKEVVEIHSSIEGLPTREYPGWYIHPVVISSPSPPKPIDHGGPGGGPSGGPNDGHGGPGGGPNNGRGGPNDGRGGPNDGRGGSGGGGPGTGTGGDNDKDDDISVITDISVCPPTEFGPLSLAKKHFKIWNINLQQPRVDQMGGNAGKIYWTENFFPPDFNHETIDSTKQEAYDEMKTKMTDYFACLNKIKDIEAHMRNGTSLKRHDSSGKEIVLDISEMKKEKKTLKKRMETLYERFKNIVLTKYPEKVKDWTFLG
jgi:hypothetical protein